VIEIARPEKNLADSLDFVGLSCAITVAEDGIRVRTRVACPAQK
jgi:hypothetical protein